MESKSGHTGTGKQRGTFSSSLGFMLVAIGGAVGLGNVWSFPFKCGRGGGFPFLILYILCVFLLGIPLAMAEFGIGRKMRCGPVQAYRRLRKKWSVIGWLSTFACIGVMGYYCLICGWILKYVCMFGLSCLGLDGSFWAMDSFAYFQAFTASPLEPLLWTAVFMAVNYLIIHKNIAAGLEKACKVMIPALVAIMIVVAIRSCTLPGAGEGLAYLFQPDLSTFQANGGFFAVLALAMLQMFFSVNIGYSTNLVCGSYMTDDTSILRSAVMVPIADMIVAVLAGLATIPAVFAFGYEPTAGAGMLFITLKAVFSTMPGGRFFGFIFFLAVLFAALTSTIAMTADIAAVPVDGWNWTEKKATLVSSVVSVLIAVPVSLGYGVWDTVKPLAFLGKDLNLLDSIDFICQNCFANVSAFLMCVFVGWIWKPAAVIEEIEKTGPFTWKKCFTIVIRYVAPVICFIVMLGSLGVL